MNVKLIASFNIKNAEDRTSLLAILSTAGYLTRLCTAQKTFLNEYCVEVYEEEKEHTNDK